MQPPYDSVGIGDAVAWVVAPMASPTYLAELIGDDSAAGVTLFKTHDRDAIPGATELDGVVTAIDVVLSSFAMDGNASHFTPRTGALEARERAVAFEYRDRERVLVGYVVTVEVRRSQAVDPAASPT